MKPGEAVTVEGNPAQGQAKDCVRSLRGLRDGDKAVRDEGTRVHRPLALFRAGRMGPCDWGLHLGRRATGERHRPRHRRRPLSRWTPPVAHELFRRGSCCSVPALGQGAVPLPATKSAARRSGDALHAPGGPRQFHSSNGFQFIEQKEVGRVLVLHGGGNRNWRVIYTDGRPLAPADEVVAGYYRYLGRQVGKATRWLWSPRATARTSGSAMAGCRTPRALRLTEKFTRTESELASLRGDGERSARLQRPWSGSWMIQWVPGKEIEEFFCEENAESTFER